MKKIKNILLLFPVLLSCCGHHLYKIDESHLDKIKQSNHAFLEIPLRETETINGKEYPHSEWSCFLTVNDIVYYKGIKFQPGTTVQVPIPTGNIVIHLVLSSFAGDVSYIGPFSRNGFGDIEDIYMSIVPNETVRLKTIVPNKITYGKAGGIGFFMVFPYPHPESYIRFEREKSK